MFVWSFCYMQVLNVKVKLRLTYDIFTRAGEEGPLLT